MKHRPCPPRLEIEAGEAGESDGSTKTFEIGPKLVRRVKV